jgi:hypothetical protein
MTLRWAFLSGIEANTTGTGRFMQHLQNAILARGTFDGTILYAPATRPLGDDMRRMVEALPHLVIFHPQMMGAQSAVGLMEARAAAGRRTHLYLLDNSFFCVRSYNHLDQDVGPCFRCLGPGQGVNALAMGCRPWPAADAYASAYIAALEQFVHRGQVALYAQNRGQIALAQRHFGPEAPISYAGLWCADWTSYVDAFMAAGRTPGDDADAKPMFDVVYHGSRDPAKGVAWVLAVAARTPEIKYLVPVDRGQVDFAAPANVTAMPMRWDSGLFDAVRTARLVLAPSLWSSPCEGALIKNIVIARAPAVVDIPSAFSAEVPPEVLLRLPQHPDQAAIALRAALTSEWRPDPEVRRRWVADFRRFNEAVADRLLPQDGSA